MFSTCNVVIFNITYLLLTYYLPIKFPPKANLPEILWPVYVWFPQSSLSSPLDTCVMFGSWTALDELMCLHAISHPSPPLLNITFLGLSPTLTPQHALYSTSRENSLSSEVTPLFYLHLGHNLRASRDIHILIQILRLPTKKREEMKNTNSCTWIIFVIQEIIENWRVTKGV